MSDFTEDPEYYTQVGKDLLERGQREEAIRAFEQALRLDPDSAYVHYVIGEPLSDVGRMQEASYHYQEAARLDPEDPDPWIGLGWIAMQEERWIDECAAYDRALEIQPDCVTALINLGVCYVQLGFYEEAVRLLRQAEALTPDDTEIPVTIAKALQAAGDMDPNTALAHSNLANQFYEVGREEEAFLACKAAIQAGSSLCRVYHILGEIMESRDRMSAARFWWKRGLAQPWDEATPLVREALREARRRRVSRRARGTKKARIRSSRLS